jgi:hypothetical protein
MYYDNDKCTNILENFYKKDNEKPSVNILTEDEDTDKNGKKLNSYQKCFIKKLKEYGKSIPEMTEEEKIEFFSIVKKECKKNK